MVGGVGNIQINKEAGKARGGSSTRTAGVVISRTATLCRNSAICQLTRRGADVHVDMVMCSCICYGVDRDSVDAPDQEDFIFLV